MIRIAYLACHHLALHKSATTLLVLSIALLVFVPAGMCVATARSATHLLARANATPLLIGADGSPQTLVQTALCFEGQPPPPIPYGESTRVRRSDLARSIPLHTHYHTHAHPIVGTTLGYFDLRNLRIADGRRFAMLGECVVGARVARDLELAPGASLACSPDRESNSTDAPALEMSVVGVLAPAHSPDDDTVFVDLKTTWILDGLVHGHEQPEGRYLRITEENVGSFHIHGDLPGFPITAVIALPFDEASSARLRERYAAGDPAVQCVRPSAVVGELAATPLAVWGSVAWAVVCVGVVVVLTWAAVLAVMLRRRRREVEGMIESGGESASATAVLALAAGIVVAVSAVLAAGGVVLVGWCAPGFVRGVWLG